MEKRISLKNLRPELPSIVKDIDATMNRYVVSKRGKPVVVMLSVDDYTSMQETLDVLSNKEVIQGIQKGLLEIKHGKTESWEAIKLRHDLH